jgi:hypothetical protein
MLQPYRSLATLGMTRALGLPFETIRLRFGRDDGCQKRKLAPMIGPYRTWLMLLTVSVPEAAL